MQVSSLRPEGACGRGRGAGRAGGEIGINPRESAVDMHPEKRQAVAQAPLVWNATVLIKHSAASQPGRCGPRSGFLGVPRPTRHPPARQDPERPEVGLEVQVAKKSTVFSAGFAVGDHTHLTKRKKTGIEMNPPPPGTPKDLTHQDHPLR